MKRNRDIKKLVRPLKRALHSCDYAAELHPTNKDGKRDLHLNILIEANNIEYFKNRILYFLGDWGIGYVQLAHTPRKHFHTCPDKVMQNLFAIKVI